jgi:predicted metal-dependent peptidase
MPRRAKGRAPELDPATKAFVAGRAFVDQHPLFGALLRRVGVVRQSDNLCPPRAWAIVTLDAQIHVHPTRRGEPEEWSYVLAHLLLHLGLDHVGELRRGEAVARRDPVAFNTAACCQAHNFLAALKVGRPPLEMAHGDAIPTTIELHRLAEQLARGVPPELRAVGAAGDGGRDILGVRANRWTRDDVNWPAVFANGIRFAVGQAVRVASGTADSLTSAATIQSPAERARRWFVNSYPLLGALAAHFRIVEDPIICQRLSISVAAVSEERREIYVNPAAGLMLDELRFVMAHEMLHVGLRHAARERGRDPYLWNVACDYAINEWLIAMGIGSIPAFGGLHDPALQGLSAESIYDRIVTDLRRYRKLATLRGYGLSDVLVDRPVDWWDSREAVELDELYRRMLSQGLVYHHEMGRGLLPAGLVEEIRALAMPPIPWDVELARWFDRYFAPIEKRRSYARPSRRQSATPDIPRPRWVLADAAEDGRTFGVVLDTSGSMHPQQLGHALGAIASFAVSRDVPAARVVFCDAAVYDAGYLPPEAIAERVQVKGRGGTVLQPAIDFLEQAADFPKDAPLLVVTDGLCDVLTIHRPHAFLMSEGASLPFVPRGPVFRMPNPGFNRERRS